MTGGQISVLFQFTFCKAVTSIIPKRMIAMKHNLIALKQPPAPACSFLQGHHILQAAIKSKELIALLPSYGKALCLCVRLVGGKGMTVSLLDGCTSSEMKGREGGSRWPHLCNCMLLAFPAPPKELPFSRSFYLKSGFKETALPFGWLSSELLSIRWRRLVP